MSVITIHHLIAVLKIDNLGKTIGNKIQRLETIKSRLTSSTHFSVAAWALCPITLVGYGTSVTDLVDAQTLVTTQRGQSGNRNTKLGIAKVNAETIMHSLVQVVADADRSNAETIILSGGYFIRKIIVHLPRINDALNSEIAGTIILTAETDGHTEWEISKDKVTLGPKIPSTSGNHTMVSGLTTGDVWYCRNHKVNTTKVTYGWSPWIEIKIGAGGKNVGTTRTTGHGGGLPTT